MISHFPQTYIDVGDLGKRQERYAKFKGTARIDISHLHFDSSSSNDYQCLRPKNVERLKNIFATEGCHRLDPANHVKALISQDELHKLLQRSKISQDTFYNCGESDKPPKLEPEAATTLRILYGRHRLEAAREFFISDDSWWTVDLYSDGRSSIV